MGTSTGGMPDAFVCGLGNFPFAVCSEIATFRQSLFTGGRFSEVLFKRFSSSSESKKDVVSASCNRHCSVYSASSSDMVFELLRSWSVELLALVLEQ